MLTTAIFRSKYSYNVRRQFVFASSESILKITFQRPEPPYTTRFSVDIFSFFLNPLLSNQRVRRTAICSTPLLGLHAHSCLLMRWSLVGSSEPVSSSPPHRVLFVLTIWIYSSRNHPVYGVVVRYPCFSLLVTKCSPAAGYHMLVLFVCPRLDLLAIRQAPATGYQVLALLFVTRVSTYWLSGGRKLLACRCWPFCL